MKQAIIILLLFCSTQISAQEPGLDKFSEVVEVEGKTAQQLYGKAKEWFVLSFNSADAVIQLDDPDNKKLIGKGLKTILQVGIAAPIPINVNYTLVVETRDGRYKQSIKNIYYSAMAGGKFSPEEIERLTTLEGLKAFYVEQGISTRYMKKKQFEKVTDSYGKLLHDLNSEMEAVLADIKEAMTTTALEENW